MLSILSHRNIIQFYGAVTTQPNYCLVTGEYSTLYQHCQALAVSCQLSHCALLALVVDTGEKHHLCLVLLLSYWWVNAMLKALSLSLVSRETTSLC